MSGPRERPLPPAQGKHDPELRWRDGLDREARAALQEHHARETGLRAQFCERHEARQRGERLDVDGVPARGVARALRVVGGVRGIELRGIRMAGTDDARQAGHAARLRARVVEEHDVPARDVVAQEVPGLVVPHAAPARRALRRPPEVVEGEDFRLGLEEPVMHPALARGAHALRARSETGGPRTSESTIARRRSPRASTNAPREGTASAAEAGIAVAFWSRTSSGTGSVSLSSDASGASESSVTPPRTDRGWGSSSVSSDSASVAAGAGAGDGLACGSGVSPRASLRHSSSPSLSAFRRSARARSSRSPRSACAGSPSLSRPTWVKTHLKK